MKDSSALKTMGRANGFPRGLGLAWELCPECIQGNGQNLIVCLEPGRAPLHSDGSNKG